jgi:hypothetical protein
VQHWVLHGSCGVLTGCVLVKDRSGRLKEFLGVMKNREGRVSVVGITICYGLDGLGIESRWGEIFRTRPDRPWGPPNLLYNGYGVFQGGKAAGAWL